MIRLEIDIGQGPRAVEIDPEDITLGFLEDIEEAQSSGKWKPIVSALGELLHLTPAERRAITLRQFKQIGGALSESVRDQTALPNA